MCRIKPKMCDWSDDYLFTHVVVQVENLRMRVNRNFHIDSDL